MTITPPPNEELLRRLPAPVQLEYFRLYNLANEVGDNGVNREFLEKYIDFTVNDYQKGSEDVSRAGNNRRKIQAVYQNGAIRREKFIAQFDNEHHGDPAWEKLKEKIVPQQSKAGDFMSWLPWIISAVAAVGTFFGLGEGMTGAIGALLAGVASMWVVNTVQERMATEPSSSATPPHPRGLGRYRAPPQRGPSSSLPPVPPPHEPGESLSPKEMGVTSAQLRHYKVLEGESVPENIDNMRVIFLDAQNHIINGDIDQDNQKVQTKIIGTVAHGGFSIGSVEVKDARGKWSQPQVTSVHGFVAVNHDAGGNEFIETDSQQIGPALRSATARARIMRLGNIQSSLTSAPGTMAEVTILPSDGDDSVPARISFGSNNELLSRSNPGDPQKRVNAYIVPHHVRIKGLEGTAYVPEFLPTSVSTKQEDGSWKKTRVHALGVFAKYNTEGHGGYYVDPSAPGITTARQKLAMQQLERSETTVTSNPEADQQSQNASAASMPPPDMRAEVKDTEGNMFVFSYDKNNRLLTGTKENNEANAHTKLYAERVPDAKGVHNHLEFRAVSVMHEGDGSWSDIKSIPRGIHPYPLPLHQHAAGPIAISVNLADPKLKPTMESLWTIAETERGTRKIKYEDQVAHVKSPATDIEKATEPYLTELRSPPTALPPDALTPPGVSPPERYILLNSEYKFVDKGDISTLAPKLLQQDTWIKGHKVGNQFVMTGVSFWDAKENKLRDVELSDKDINFPQSLPKSFTIRVDRTNHNHEGIDQREMEAAKNFIIDRVKELRKDTPSLGRPPSFPLPPLPAPPEEPTAPREQASYSHVDQTQLFTFSPNSELPQKPAAKNGPESDKQLT